MLLLRWLSVAVLALAATSASHAQNASFSILGLRTLFGQEAPADEGLRVLPWSPLAAGDIFKAFTGGFTFNFPRDDASEEAEELPSSRRCEIDLLSAFVPECLKCWKEQWSLGNYPEAEMLAAIACRLDPTNRMARHALALSEFMRDLVGAHSPMSAAEQSRLLNGQFAPFGPVNSQFAGTGLKEDCHGCPGCPSVKTLAESVNRSPTVDQVERSIERKLSEPVSLTFKDTPLHQVISDLNMLVPGANIALDRLALQEAGIGLDTPLTLAAERIALKSALNVLLDQAKLTYVIRDQCLMITTKEKAMVNQTQEVQEQIAALFQSLRRLQNDLEVAANKAQITACCKEAGACAAVGAAKTCSSSVAIATPACAGCAKACANIPKPEIYRSGQLTAAFFRDAIKRHGIKTVLNLQDDCCCTEGAKVAIKTCACPPQAAACCCASQTAVPRQAPVCCCDKAACVILPAPPLTVIREVANDRNDQLYCEELSIVLPAPLVAPRPATGSVVAVSPPMFLHSPLPPHGMLFPAPASSQFQGMTALTGLTPAGTLTPDLGIPIQNGNLGFIHPRGFGIPVVAAPEKVLADVNAIKARTASQPATPLPATARHNVHLVTPHLEAHCERLTSVANADHILLEGDVHLTCNRNGQTLRIQGQRVLVHLRDGTFTVESMSDLRQPAPAQRVGGLVPARTHVQPVGHSAPPAPWEIVRPLRPVDDTPADEPDKHDNEPDQSE
jgi:hypothetical protein